MDELTELDLEFLVFNGQKPKQILPLRAEASTRRYFRVQYENTNYILCKDSKLQTDFLTISGFLNDNNVLVPVVLKSDEENALILMTDAGNQDLAAKDDPDELEDFYKIAMNTILAMQRLEVSHPVKQRRFDYEKYSSENLMTMKLYREFQKRYSIKTELTAEVVLFLDEVASFLDQYPIQVFVHRDYHSRNLMINSADELVVIDFQDARLGNPFYDLSSLLYDSYKPLSRKKRQEYCDYFLSKLPEKFPKSRECYYLQALQRSYKALGTYFKMVLENRYFHYKESIESALENCLEITQIAMLPDQVFLFFHLLQKELQKNKTFQEEL